VVLTCFNHVEESEFVNGEDDIPYMKWNIIQMFETTNQIFLFPISIMENSLKMEVSSWENHRFLWAMASMAMLNNQRVIMYIYIYG